MIIRKICGSSLFVIGSLVCAWGIWIFVMSIYYLATANSKMSGAAGIGFFYGLVVVAIGFIPILIGNLIFSWKKSILYRLFFEK